MALIKPQQLKSGSFSISGSFSGSFQGDGSILNNITASLAPNYTLTSSFNTFTSSYVQDSSSFDTRILNNSGSINIISGSFETFSGSYLQDSSSFDTRILTNSSSIDILSDSFETFTQTYNTGSFTGSFMGDGNGLFNIPASGIVGLNLSQIVSGSVSASISPDSGLQINTNVTATSFTGSLSGTASFAQTASYVETAQTASYVLQAVSSSFASSGTGEFTGSFTGSFVGDGSGLDNLNVKTLEYIISYNDVNEIHQLIEDSIKINTVSTSSTLSSYQTSINGGGFSTPSLPLTLSSNDELVWQISFNSGQTLGSLSVKAEKL
jgi:hypothetical protein